MLRALTLERSQIKEAMGFALDNADAAGEVLFVPNSVVIFRFTDIICFIDILQKLLICYNLLICTIHLKEALYILSSTHLNDLIESLSIIIVSK